jgi:hypothetical protein
LVISISEAFGGKWVIPNRILWGVGGGWNMPEFREGFSALDRPEILQLVFYPRKDFSPQPKVPNAANYFISVEEGISICCRFYFNDERSPNILFFHGNGEIASDYDDIGPLYTQTGVNLFVADYRGYGLSGGEPTFTNLIRDAHLLWDAP